MPEEDVGKWLAVVIMVVAVAVVVIMTVAVYGCRGRGSGWYRGRVVLRLCLPV
jgi:hypothetical protein